MKWRRAHKRWMAREPARQRQLRVQVSRICMVGLAQINSIRSATGDPLTRHIAGVRCVAETLKALGTRGCIEEKEPGI